MVYPTILAITICNLVGTPFYSPTFLPLLSICILMHFTKSVATQFLIQCRYYHYRVKMLILSGGKGFSLKEEVADEPYDPRIEVLSDVKGKSKKTKILELDLTYTTLFPQMYIDVFYEMESGLNGEVQCLLKYEFLNLFHLKTMHLWNLPVFETIGEVM
jgi:hypothetical protein